MSRRTTTKHRKGIDLMVQYGTDFPWDEAWFLSTYEDKYDLVVRSIVVDPTKIDYVFKMQNESINKKIKEINDSSN
jgi:hypothetical protein